MLIRAMDLDGFALETVQPSLIADCAQVLNKSGKYLVRVCFAKIDEAGTFWRCVNAGNYALDIDFLASVFGSLRWLNCVYRQHCRSHRKKNGEDQEKERFHHRCDGLISFSQTRFTDRMPEANRIS